MPTSGTVLEDVSGQTRLRWRETYTSEGLNQKTLASVPRGIYRGFHIQAQVSPSGSIDVLPDPTTNDNVAVYETADPYQLTLHYFAQSPSIVLHLTPGITDGHTYVIGLYATYAIGVTTVAQIVAYDLTVWNGGSPPAEKAQVVVLGTVTVSATIAQSAIDYSLQTQPWQNQSKGSQPWTPMVRNGGFEGARGTGQAPPAAADPWVLSEALVGTGWWSVATTPNVNHGQYSLEFDMAGTPVATTIKAVQLLGAVEVSGGNTSISQKARFVFALQNLQALTGGSANVILYGKDASGGPVTGQFAITLPATTGSTWVPFDITVQVPNLMTTLNTVGIYMDSALAASSGAVIRVDDFQCYLQPIGQTSVDALDERLFASETASLLTIGNTAGDTAAVALAPSISGNQLTFQRADGTDATTPTLFDIQSQIQVGDALVGTAANCVLPRIKTPVAVSGTSAYTLIWEGESTVAAGKGKARMYAGQGTLAFTTNAKWQSAGNWTKDIAGNAQKVYFTVSAGFQSLVMPSGISDPVSTWADNAWLVTQISVLYGATTTPTKFGQLISDRLATSSTLLQNDVDALAGLLLTAQAGSNATTTLIQTFDSSATNTGAQVRIYRSGYGTGFAGVHRLQKTFNASWSGTNWVADDTVHPAWMIEDILDVTGPITAGSRYSYKTTTAAPWSVWDHTPGLVVDPVLYDASVGSPPTPQANGISSQSVAKAWCVGHSNSSSTGVLLSGTNVSSITCTSIAITINFTVPMVASAGNSGVEVTNSISYAANIRVLNSAKWGGTGQYPGIYTLPGPTVVDFPVVVTHQKTTGSLIFAVWDSNPANGTNPVDATAYDVYFEIEVFSRQ